ncbi:MULTISPECIES: major coat protein [unclassified Halomonas]|uniref:major coat protein n=1 Tax=unclassified Halomonas TaxID=2609666 RepID=UPI0009905B61|nr:MULTISPECIES: major coat protein [unclassified Halomonas]AVU10613.1 hypothetical protein BV504_13080 [Halomonas sp. 'Soap Lake \
MTMKSLFQNAKNAVGSTSTKVAAGAAVSVGMIGNAQADASAAFSEIQSTGADMAGQAWPVVAAITASLIGIKLFKKFANRAS